MALVTFDQMCAGIKRWCWDRNDLVGLIPDAIVLAESRMNDSLRVAQMETQTTLTLVDGSAELPDDYLAWRRINSTDNPLRNLEYLDPDLASDTYPSGTAYLSSFFTIVGNTVKTYPTSSGTLQLTYYQQIPPLSENVSGNWVTRRKSGLYLYGALLELSVFFDDDERVATWGTLYDRSMKELQGSDVTTRYAKVAMRIKGVTP
jgi:hypothetical protein